MRKKNIWAWAVLLVAGMLLLTGCSTLLEEGFGPLPAMDANGDNVMDPAFVDAVNAGKVTVDAVTGGAFSFWLNLAAEGILGGLALFFVGKRGVKKYKEIKSK